VCEGEVLDNLTVRTDFGSGTVVLEIEDSQIWRFTPADAKLVGIALVKCGECLEERERPRMEDHARPS
jgi:hypothetical protein